MRTPMFDDLIRANAAYADRFALAGIPPGAAKGFALVTCMDSRIEPLTMLGLVPGDAKILRNAGGRVTPDVIRSLVLAAHLLDVREIAVMQHTGCAMADTSDDRLRSVLAERGVDGMDEWDFWAMPDPDAALAEDVARLRACAQFPDGVVIEGWRYDVGTGRVRRLLPS